MSDGSTSHRVPRLAVFGAVVLWFSAIKEHDCALRASRGTQIRIDKRAVRHDLGRFCRLAKSPPPSFSGRWLRLRSRRGSSRLSMCLEQREKQSKPPSAPLRLTSPHFVQHLPRKPGERCVFRKKRAGRLSQPFCPRGSVNLPNPRPIPAIFFPKAIAKDCSTDPDQAIPHRDRARSTRSCAHRSQSPPAIGSSGARSRRATQQSRSIHPHRQPASARA